jgi:hypothetical protein
VSIFGRGSIGMRCNERVPQERHLGHSLSCRPSTVIPDERSEDPGPRGSTHMSMSPSLRHILRRVPARLCGETAAPSSGMTGDAHCHPSLSLSSRPLTVTPAKRSVEPGPRGSTHMSMSPSLRHILRWVPARLRGESAAPSSGMTEHAHCHPGLPLSSRTSAAKIRDPGAQLAFQCHRASGTSTGERHLSPLTGVCQTVDALAAYPAV